MAKPAITMKVRTYLDVSGMGKAVDEAKRPILKKSAIRIKNDARRSMKKAPAHTPTLADLLPGPLKAFATLGAQALFQQAASVGIPPAVISVALKRARGDRLRKRKGLPSKPGQPPNVQSGKLRRGVIAEMDAKTGNVQVGPSGEGWYGRVHEFGTGKHPKRPLMAPALEKNRKRLPQDFKKMQISKTKSGRKMNRVKGAKGPKAAATI